MLDEDGRRFANEIERQQRELLRIRSQMEALRLRLARYEPGGDQPPEITSDFINVIIDARNAREKFLGEHLFADPAWDLLLNLFAAELDQRRVSKTDLCSLMPAPQSTTFRWIHKLQRDGLTIEHADPLDRRRLWVELSPRCFLSMQRYFEALGLALPKRKYRWSDHLGR